MKTLRSLHVYIFLCDFAVHYTIFRYDVCLEEYMDVSPRLRKWQYIRRYKTYEKDKEECESKKELNTTLTYSSIHQNIELATTLL